MSIESGGVFHKGFAVFFVRALRIFITQALHFFEVSGQPFKTVSEVQADKVCVVDITNAIYVGKFTVIAFMEVWMIVGIVSTGFKLGMLSFVINGYATEIE